MRCVGTSERQKRYVKGKRDRGECFWGSCRELSGRDTRCPLHAELHAKKAREYRARKAKGDSDEAK